jgi:hypothetical protein
MFYNTEQINWFLIYERMFEFFFLLFKVGFYIFYDLDCEIMVCDTFLEVDLTGVVADYGFIDDCYFMLDCCLAAD